FAADIPTVPVQRRMNLAAVAAAPAAVPDRPGWPAVFLKAYALVCRDVPALRRGGLPPPPAPPPGEPPEPGRAAVGPGVRRGAGGVLRPYQGPRGQAGGRVARPGPGVGRTTDRGGRAVPVAPADGGGAGAFPAGDDVVRAERRPLPVPPLRHVRAERVL